MSVMLRAVLLALALVGPPKVTLDLCWWDQGRQRDVILVEPGEDPCHDAGVEVERVTFDPYARLPQRLLTRHRAVRVLVIRTREGQWMAFGSDLPAVDEVVARNLDPVYLRWVDVVPRNP